MNIGVIVGVFYDFWNSFCQVNLYTENFVAKERKYKNLTSYWGQNKSYTVKSWKIQTHKVTDTIYTLNNCTNHIHKPLKITMYIQTLSVPIRCCVTEQAEGYCQISEPNKSRKKLNPQHTYVHKSAVTLAIYMLYVDSHMFSFFFWTENTQMKNSVVVV